MKKIVSIFIAFAVNFIVLTNVYAEEYEEYKSGELVRYNDIVFYVLFDSDSTEDSVQLLKMIPLTHEEINKYTEDKAYLYVLNDSSYEYRKSDDSILYGNMAFYYGDECYYKSNSDSNTSFTGVYSKCSNDYAVSNVKNVIDLWTEENINNDDIVLLEDGYKSRLLNASEIIKVDSTNKFSYFPGFSFRANKPDWLINLNYYGWTMEKHTQDVSPLGRVFYSIQTIPSNYSWILGSYPCEKGSVRPTVKIKKSLVSKIKNNEYHNNEVREYKIGDIINYNDTKFYVIKNSGESDSTVTLLKDKPLTKFELETYGEGYINNYVDVYNNYYVNQGEVISDNGFKIAYLSTDKCYYNGANKQFDYSGCNYNYDDSNVKHIVDNWMNETISNDDIGIDNNGYSSRLINIDDINRLGFYVTQVNDFEDYNCIATDHTAIFMLNENTNGMLTMIQNYIVESSNGNISYGIDVADNKYNFVARKIPNNTIGTVRPVVTLNKKEIEKKITNVEEITDENVEVDIVSNIDSSNIDNSSNIKVPNTLSSKSFVAIFIGFSLVLISFSIYYFIKGK